MRYLKYKFGLVDLPFEAPDNWGDVPFSTYVKYVKLIQDGKADNQAKIYSLFMPKVSAEYWDKPHDPKIYNSINGQLNFISEEPSKEVPTHIIKDGVEILTPKSVDEVTVNQYWGMLKAVDDVIKGKGDDVSTLEIMPEMIAIMLFKEYDNTSIEQIADEIRELPTDKVYGLGCFFFGEIKRFEEWHNSNMPNKKPNQAYLSAGYGRVSDYYGNLITLNNLSKGVFSEREIILQTKVIEVYIELQVSANLQECERKYSELIRKK